MTSESVILVPPRDDWPQLAQQEAERFAALLNCALIRVHHIGSTSIPGIWAKPVIDLLPEVHSVSHLDLLQETLEAHGYEYRGEYGLPRRRFCPRIDPERGRVTNIHCYEKGDPELLRHLAFRDYLRAHPLLAAEYEREKLRARDLHPHDVFAYNDAKDSWIRECERQALEWADRNRAPALPTVPYEA